ncbi:MAG TPA: carbohydrate kinase family protein [Candidatus Dormibacteraeota bacterium]|nr:carbohydrate kinase family protein [Candidatus Dormibacteraeota bacterium]
MDHSHIRVISIGSATQDVFLMGKNLAAKRDVRTHSYVEQFPLGAKLDIEAVHYDTGGGAANAAVTFARQGLTSSYSGKIGRDPAGAEIMRVLKKEGIITSHVKIDHKHGTGYSTILLAPNGERTILSYRGASSYLRPEDFYNQVLDADWFYISSLSGNLELLKRLLLHASKYNIKVALNPGGGELANAAKLRKLLSQVHILMANRQEMQLLFGGETPVETMVNAMPECHYVVMTDGPRGSYATVGNIIYYTGQYKKVKVVDRLGAGDAFCSGFVAAIAKGMPIEDAMSLGSANSTSVVEQIGAKAGILREGHKVKRMKVKRASI